MEGLEGYADERKRETCFIFVVLNLIRWLSFVGGGGVEGMVVVSSWSDEIFVT